jgi:hypothetical protein
MSGAAAGELNVRMTADRILEKDRAQRAREHRLRAGGLCALLVLVPVQLWAAAYGVSPLVRIAYALMAVGYVAGLVAEWLYLDWSRRALPGPDDTRAQLQRTAFMVECQLRLAKTAALWSAPVFIGGVLIAVWLYRERSAAGGMALCAFIVASWIGSGVWAARGAAALGLRKRQLEDVLADLREDAQSPPEDSGVRS